MAIEQNETVISPSTINPAQIHYPQPQEVARRKRLLIQMEEYKRGSLPTNKDLKSWINAVLNSSLLNVQMSSTGKVVLDDIKTLLSTFMQVLNEKNSDELFQTFMYHVRLASRITREERKRTGRIKISTSATTTKRRRSMVPRKVEEKNESATEKVKRKLRIGEPKRVIYIGGTNEQIYYQKRSNLALRLRKQSKALYRILRLTLTNSDFRNVMKTSGEWFQHAYVFGDKLQFDQQAQPPTTEKRKEMTAEEEIMQTSSYYKEEDLAQCERRESEWKGEKEGVRGESTLESSIRKYGSQVEGTKEDISTLEHGRLPEQRKSESQTGYGKSESQWGRAGETEEWKVEEGKEKYGFEKKKKEKKHRQKPSSDLVQDISLKTVKQFPIVTTSETVKGQPQRPSEMTIRSLLDQLKPILATFAKKSQFESVVVDFFNFFKEMVKQSGMVHKPKSRRREGQEEEEPGYLGVLPQEWQYDANLKEARSDFKKLMERFANNHSLDPLLNCFSTLVSKSKADYSLQDFFGDCKSFLDSCISDVDYMNSVEYYNRGEFLLKRLHQKELKVYKPLFDQLFQEYNSFVGDLNSDSVTQSLFVNTRKLFQSTTTKIPILDKDFLSDLRYKLLPSLMNHYQAFPLPRIEVIDPTSHLILEDLVLVSDQFMPGELQIVSTQEIRMNPKERILGIRMPSRSRTAPATTDEWQNGFRLHLSSLQSSLNNVKFFYHKKSGFFKMKDSGLADLQILGKGMSIHVEVFSTSNYERSIGYGYLKTGKVIVNIDKLRIALHNTRHDKSYKLMSPIINMRVKRQMEKALTTRIIDLIEKGDRQLGMVAQKMGFVSKTRIETVTA